MVLLWLFYCLLCLICGRFGVGSEFEKFVTSDFGDSGGADDQSLGEFFVHVERVFVAISESDQCERGSFFGLGELEDCAFRLVGLSHFRFVVALVAPSENDGDDQAEDSGDDEGSGSRGEERAIDGDFFVVSDLDEIPDRSSQEEEPAKNHEQKSSLASCGHRILTQSTEFWSSGCGIVLAEEGLEDQEDGAK